MADGATVECQVTFLEMASRPRYPRPHQPGGGPAHLLVAASAPVWYFRALYDAVGRDYAWLDLHDWSDEALATRLSRPGAELWSLIQDGWPKGFFLLEGAAAEPVQELAAAEEAAPTGICQLSYFGLAPQAIGRGLGHFLLRSAVHIAWDRPETRRLTVNTCTFDHPRALGLYQKAGFRAVRRETQYRRKP